MHRTPYFLDIGEPLLTSLFVLFLSHDIRFGREKASHKIIIHFRTFKRLVKLSNQRDFGLCGCNIPGEIGLQKLQKVWVAKLSKRFHTFFVRLLHWAQIPLDSLSCCVLSIFKTNILVAPSETVSLTLMR